MIIYETKVNETESSKLQRLKKATSATGVGLFDSFVNCRTYND